MAWAHKKRRAWNQILLQAPLMYRKRRELQFKFKLGLNHATINPFWRNSFCWVSWNFVCSRPKLVIESTQTSSIDSYSRSCELKQLDLQS
mmetsp:Transcript_1825/g.4142  ORF Transcript_1825/g.4142 Transcript_1825/m.4142 type:complete len:90 (-) Transcript_1825:180-449(-)